MTIFDTFSLTQYGYIYHNNVPGSLPVWDTWSDQYRTTAGGGYYGVFKPRTTSDVFNESVSSGGDATLNIRPTENWIDELHPDKMIGDYVSVDGQVYIVSGVDTATNYRTGEVEHYRLHLKLTRSKQP